MPAQALTIETIIVQAMWCTTYNNWEESAAFVMTSASA